MRKTSFLSRICEQVRPNNQIIFDIDILRGGEKKTIIHNEGKEEAKILISKNNSMLELLRRHNNIFALEQTKRRLEEGLIEINNYFDANHTRDDKTYKKYIELAQIYSQVIKQLQIARPENFLNNSIVNNLDELYTPIYEAILGMSPKSEKYEFVANSATQLALISAYGIKPLTFFTTFNGYVDIFRNLSKSPIYSDLRLDDRRNLSLEIFDRTNRHKFTRINL